MLGVPRARDDLQVDLDRHAARRDFERSEQLRDRQLRCDLARLAIYSDSHVSQFDGYVIEDFCHILGLIALGDNGRNLTRM